VCCSVVQCGAVCCSVLQCGAVWCSVVQCGAVCSSVVQCVAACCSVMQCVAVRCSVLQCVAMCCSVRVYQAEYFLEHGHREPNRWQGIVNHWDRCHRPFLKTKRKHNTFKKAQYIQHSRYALDTRNHWIWQFWCMKPIRSQSTMGWLRLVGFLKLQVSFEEYSVFCMVLSEKRPIILRSLLIVATPYLKSIMHLDTAYCIWSVIQS